MYPVGTERGHIQRVGAARVTHPRPSRVAIHGEVGDLAAPARVAVAHIVSPFPDLPGLGLALALEPGFPIERFGRTWRVELGADALGAVQRLRRGTPKSASEIPSTLQGRLGFDKTTGVAPAWNEAAKRFEQREQHDGDVVPFVIRLRDLSVAFQRTSKVRRQSFIGALQRILRDASGDPRWKVDDRLTRLSWGQFKAEVSRVTEIAVTVGPTNPGWQGQELFQPFIEEVGAERAKIVMTGDILDIDSRPVDQARVHALDHEYGSLLVKGLTEDNVAMRFNSEDPVPILDTGAERRPDGLVAYETLEAAIEQADAIAEDIEQQTPSSPSERGSGEDESSAGHLD